MYLIIGDVHGEVNILKKLLNDISDDYQHLIFTGDYINRGENSKEVLDELVKLSKKKKCTFIKGNHEVELLKYIKSGMLFDFLQIGGASTLLSYCKEFKNNVHKEFVDSFPESHINFLNSLIPSIQINNFIISHSGPTLFKSIKDFSKNLSSKNENEVHICGHYPQKSKKPFISKTLICLDTGCGSINGPLTALSIPNIEYKLYY